MNAYTKQFVAQKKKYICCIYELILNEQNLDKFFEVFSFISTVILIVDKIGKNKTKRTTFK